MTLFMFLLKLSLLQLLGALSGVSSSHPIMVGFFSECVLTFCHYKRLPLIVCISSPSPRINQFSKEPW